MNTYLFISNLAKVRGKLEQRSKCFKDFQNFSAVFVQPKLEKIYIFLYSREMELCNSNIKKKYYSLGNENPEKNFLYFLKRMSFLNFLKRKPRKRFSAFQETVLFVLKK